jgi:hypothetical protein
MRKPVLLSLIAMLALLAFPSSAGAQATTDRSVITEAFDFTLPSSECIGEPLHVQGELTSALRVTTPPTGVLLTSGHTHADMTATGLITGDTYRIVDIREITTNLHGVAQQGTGAFAFLIVGPGPHNNLLVTNQEHITVTPNGDVTANFLNITVKCVG